MPKPSLFVRTKSLPPPSHHWNRVGLDEGQISAVVHLVSSAVSPYPPRKRHSGRSIGQPAHAINTSGRDLNDAQLKFANDVESRIQRHRSHSVAYRRER